jgi:hypothetical protein
MTVRPIRRRSPTSPGRDEMSLDWRRDLRDLWWVPPSAVPAETFLSFHTGTTNMLDIIILACAQILALALSLIAVPVAKEIAYRWAMEIRYGRDESRRRRRDLP